MSEIDTQLNNLSTAELSAATAAITAGDETALTYARELRQLISGVNNAAARTAAQAAALWADDSIFPDGKARRLSEIPGRLKADTQDQLDKAEIALDIIEGRHIERILHHDSRNDGALVAELQNYTANLKVEEAKAALVQLAANVRYSTILSGPMGSSLAARFGFDSEVFRKVALESLAVNGTEDQRRRAAALAAIPAARRVLGLARAGVEVVASEAPKPPQPKSNRLGLMG